MMEQAARAFTPVNKRRRCPMCKHSDWCEIHTQSGAVHCMRTESTHPSEYRGGGWWHNLPQPDAKTGRVVWSPEDFAPRDEDTRPPGADAPTKHAVYAALLALCPLSAKHRADLTGPTRQFPEAALATYGTLPDGQGQAPILAALHQQFGRDALLGVAGFVEDQKRPGGLRLNGAGLLIPVRDEAGRIQGIQVRADRGETRYRWLSSAEGVSSGTPAHVARPAVVTDQRVYLTEGALKADRAALKLGAIVVAISGVGAGRSALPALEALQAQGHDVAIIALDADDPAKERTVQQVEAVRLDLAAELASSGYAVRIARWDHSQGKGIDDLLLAGGTFALEAYRPIAATEECPSDSEAQRRLRYLRTVIQAPNMDRTQKVLYLNALVKGNLWPWTLPPEGGPQPPPRRLPIATIMKGAHVKSYSSARPCMEALRADGLLPYTVGLDKKTADGREVAYFQPGRPLVYDETPSKPGHLDPAKERAAEAQQSPEPDQATTPPHLSNFDRDSLTEEKGEIPLSNFDTTPPTYQTSTGPHRAPPATQRAPAADSERSGGAESLIAKFQEQATLSDLELEWRWSTTAEAGRYKRLAPEERGRVDAAYLDMRARFQGHAPPPPARAGVWEVA